MIAPEFSSAADMLAHYAAVQHRLRHVPVKPMREIPPPSMPLVEVTDGQPSATADTWLSLAHKIADRHGTNVKALVGASRAKRLMPARHELYFRMVVERGLSLKETGILMHRDHTSILHGLRRHIERNPEARADHEALKRSRDEERMARDREVYRLYQAGESLHTISDRCRIAPSNVAHVVRRMDAQQRAERIKDWAARA